MPTRSALLFAVLTSAAAASGAPTPPAAPTPSHIVGNSGPVVTGNSVGGNLTIVVGQDGPGGHQALMGAPTQDQEGALREERKLFVQALQHDPRFADVLLRLTGASGRLDAPGAIKALDEAVEQGSALAVMLRGLVYQNGWWGERDPGKAQQLMRRAADLQVPGAQLYVQSRLYDGSDGYTRDRHRSSDYLDKLIRNESATRSLRADAALWMSNRWWFGDGHPKDRCEGMRYVSMAAEMGQAEAMYNLGSHREAGEGCLPADKAEALKWYRRSADAGYQRAAADAGRMLYFGLGTPRDHAGALRYFDQGASAYADGMAAWIHLKGLHHPQKVPDYLRGLALARRAADAGDAFSMVNVGLMYEYGLGVPHNASEAFRWYGKAADSGRAMATRLQATLILNGCVSTGLMPNWLKALQALAGQPDVDARERTLAQNEMGRAHAFGLGGLPRNERLGLPLIQEACRADLAQACSLWRQLQPEARLDARLLALANSQHNNESALQTEGEVCQRRLTRPSSDPDLFP